jgi:predicted DNA-binding protein
MTCRDTIIQVRVFREEAVRLDELCTTTHRTRSDMIRHLVDEAWEEHFQNQEPLPAAEPAEALRQ